MNATSTKRRALAATLAALLVAPLAGCGATANAPTTAPDASAKSTDAASGADILDEVSADAGKEVGAGKDKIPDTKSGETGWGSSADGSSSGEPSAGGDSASAGEASEFDTWGENCTDDRGNVTVAAVNDDGTIGVTLFNDEVAKAGVLTTQGGSPRIIDVWNSYVSSL